MNENEIKELIKNSDKLVLDVRSTLAQGTDPFQIIMGEISKLKENQVFHLINGFEPKPLYNVLGNRGFEHYTEFDDGVFNVFFFKSGSQAVANGQPTPGNASAPLPGKVVELDVRGMEPPEPMMAILQKLHEMDDECVLLVHHHREPMMLYEKLEDIGWEAVANKIEENYYKVVITRKVK